MMEKSVELSQKIGSGRCETMTLIVSNPYLDQKKSLILSLDQERDPATIKILQQRYDEVEGKVREYNQRILEKLQTKVEQKVEVFEEVKTGLKINPRKQYKESIALYREVMELVTEIRHLKKECREILNLTAKKNKIQREKIDRWLQ